MSAEAAAGTDGWSAALPAGRCDDEPGLLPVVDGQRAHGGLLHEHPSQPSQTSVWTREQTVHTQGATERKKFESSNRKTDECTECRLVRAISM